MTSTDAISKTRAEHVARGVSTAHPIVAVRAEGVRVWDAEGREYLDFIGGIGVMNVGHAHPRVLRAITEQLARFTHTAFQVTMYETYVELAARLNALVAGEHAWKSALFTTGVEAVENAVKIARAHTNRAAILAFSGAFHGRTLLGLSLTASSAAYRQNFGPFAPEIYHCPFPYEYRGWTTARSLEALHEFFTTRVSPDRLAAIIIEPQQGEGGFVPAPPDFLRELRRLTRDHGNVLIADEIQTGFGRTGKMFAFEHAGITPDLIVAAKSLAGGLPLSAVIGRADIMDAPLPGGLGGTYAGNPLACAAAIAVLDVFKEEKLVERAAVLGDQIRAGLLALQARFPQIGDVRGLGAMLAIELVEDRATRAPDAALTKRVIERARAHGLLLLTCGPGKNVIRVLVPLVATLDDIARGLRILEAALAG